MANGRTNINNKKAAQKGRTDKWEMEEAGREKTNTRCVKTEISVTSKKSPNVYKSCSKIILLVKWKIWTILQNLPKMCWHFGQINCCHGLWKVAQSVINHPIWSHWLRCWDKDFKKTEREREKDKWRLYLKVERENGNVKRKKAF